MLSLIVLSLHFFLHPRQTETQPTACNHLQDNMNLLYAEPAVFETSVVVNTVLWPSDSHFSFIEVAQEPNIATTGFALLNTPLGTPDARLSRKHMNTPLFGNNLVHRKGDSLQTACSPLHSVSVMQAWVLVNKQVYAVPLTVPRTFYVNSSLAPEDPIAVALGRRVIRTLPYGQEPFNVYQVSMLWPLVNIFSALTPKLV